MNNQQQQFSFNNSDEILLNSLGISSISTSIDSNDIKKSLNVIRSQNQTRDKVVICYRILLWSSSTNVSVDDKETLLTSNIALILEIINDIVSEENDVVELFNPLAYQTGLQMSARYLAEMLFHQLSETKLSIRIMAAPLIVNCLISIMNNNIELKERAPFQNDDAPIVRLDTLNYLLKSLPKTATKNDEVDNKVVAYLLDIVGKSYYLKSIRDLCMDIVSSIGSLNADLFANHLEPLIYSLQYSSELGFIFKSCPNLFEADYDIFEKHCNFLIDTFNFVGLEATIKDIALYEPVRLIKIVPSLINQIPTSYLAEDIILVLLRIALVDITPYKDCIQQLYNNCALNPRLCKTPFFALLAVCSKSGIAEVMLVFDYFQRIVLGEVVTNMPLYDQSNLIGALEVITDKVSKEIKLSNEAVEGLTKIKEANQKAFDNIMKWNSGKWSRKGKLDCFVKSLNIVPVPKKKKIVNGRRFGISYNGNKNFLERSKQSFLQAEKREASILPVNDETMTSKTKFTFFQTRKTDGKNENEPTKSNATRRKGKLQFSMFKSNTSANVDNNNNAIVTKNITNKNFEPATPVAINSTYTPIFPPPSQLEPTPPAQRPSFINRIRQSFRGGQGQSSNN